MTNIAQQAYNMSKQCHFWLSNNAQEKQVPKAED